MRLNALAPAPAPAAARTLSGGRGIDRERERDPLEAALDRYLRPEDERAHAAVWQKAQENVRELALRPAKRVRPRLLLTGYELASGTARTPLSEGLTQFAAGLELLHTFLLIHDDVADGAALRRGGPALHHLLATQRAGAGADLAVVAGDHLFARAVELMLTSPLAHAGAATAHMLAVCRHTAVGQYLDLVHSRRPLGSVSLLQAARIVRLKTAHYSFAAPLVCGAMLGGGDARLISPLGRAGRMAGMAFQLRDDLIGIFGDDQVAGKAGDADLRERKPTLPLLVAHRNGTPAERRLLESLGPDASAEEIAAAREIVRARGGRAATERMITRWSAEADRVLLLVPAPMPVIAALRAMVARLAERKA